MRLSATPAEVSALWTRHRLIVVVVMSLAMTGCASGGAPSLMTWKEYGRLSVQWPYLLRFDSAQGSLFYYGARHSYSPQDLQTEHIERLWDCFEPTIAFNEGGNPPIEASRDVAVEKYGEAGLVRFLAARDDVPVASLDPPRAEEVAHLRRAFSATDVKLYFVLRAAAQWADRHGPEAVDAELERVLSIFNSSPGLGAPPRTVAEVAAAFRQRFPDAEDYRKAPLAWFDPILRDIPQRRLRSSGEYRDRAIVTVLGRSLADGQRVFAVVGGTHVVMQEGALRRLLGTPGRRPKDGCS